MNGQFHIKQRDSFMSAIDFLCEFEFNFTLHFPSVLRMLQYYNNEDHVRYQTYVLQPSLTTENSWHFSPWEDNNGCAILTS